MKILLLLLFSVSSFCQANGVSILPLWVRPKPADYKFYYRPQERTRPVVVGDIVYYATLSGDVHAIHRKEGYSIWHYKMPGAVDGALSYGRSKIFVGDVEGNLVALHTRNGQVAWKKKVGAQWLSAPVQIGVRLIAATSAGEVYALNERRGDELWHYSQRGDEKMSIRGTASPVVYGSDVYQGFADGYVVALSLESGKIRWRKKLSRRQRFYDVDTTVYADAKNLVAGTFDGSVYSLDRVSGDIQWRFPTGSSSGFFVSNEKVFFSGLDKHFYAVNLVTGALVWKTKFEKGVGARPVPMGDHLVVPTSDDPIYVLSQKDGKIAWQGHLGAGSLAAVAGSPEQEFYCLSNYGNLYAFSLSQGRQHLHVDKVLPLHAQRSFSPKKKRQLVDS